MEEKKGTKIAEKDILSPEALKRSGISGYVQGECFCGVWLDNSPMEGYGIYHVSNGVLPDYGDFSESGEIEDAIDAGDLIESFRETSFMVLKIEEVSE